MRLGRRRKDGEGATDTQNGCGGYEKGSWLRVGNCSVLFSQKEEAIQEAGSLASASMANGVDQDQDLASKRLHSR